jgi:rRNA maturation protein Nop10
MGAEYFLECNKCGRSVRTSGPWEFYRDKGGRRRAYGHPRPISEEAREQGVYGLSASMYCSDCGRVSSLVLVEFATPIKSPRSVWLENNEPKEEYKSEKPVKCPKCGGENLLLEPSEDREMKCFHCKEGRLILKDMWIA